MAAEEQWLTILWLPLATMANRLWKKRVRRRSVSSERPVRSRSSREESEKREVFFYNEATGESKWPEELWKLRQEAPMPAGSAATHRHSHSTHALSPLVLATEPGAHEIGSLERARQ